VSLLASLCGRDGVELDVVSPVVVDGEPVQTRTLIIASGAGHKHLDVPGEDELEKKGVTYCATCDGALPMFRNQPVVVIGGGDSACEEATYLTRFASKVYLIHRRDTLRASRIMAERTLANPKIEMVWDSVVTEVTDVAADKVTGVKLKNLKTGAESHLPCTGVFVAIGHVPNTSLFKGTLDLHENGYFKTDGTVLTKIPGVRLKFSQPFFREFLLETSRPAAAVLSSLADKGINVGPDLLRFGIQNVPDAQNCFLVALTEKRTRTEIDALAKALAEVLQLS
jgi:alkyl hydroperoxide reductase subunit AhpF